MYMTNCLPSSSYMRRRSPCRALQLAVLTGGAVVLALVLASPAAHAKDLSIPYRNYPGFQCNTWNWKNECTDFSYLDPRGAYQNVPAPQYFYHPVYTFQNATPYGYRYNTNAYYCQATRDCTGSVNVRVRGIPTVAVRGDTVTYTIYVRNDDSQYRTTKVTAVVDNDASILSASTGGYSQGNTVFWNSIRIAPGQSETLTISVRINANATLGRSMPITASTGNSSDTGYTEIKAGQEYRSIVYPNGSNPYNLYGIPSQYPVLYPSNNLNLSQQQYQYYYQNGGSPYYSYPNMQYYPGYSYPSY